jgi:hypothetical protein
LLSVCGFEVTFFVFLFKNYPLRSKNITSEKSFFLDFSRV